MTESGAPSPRECSMGPFREIPVGKLLLSLRARHFMTFEERIRELCQQVTASGSEAEVVVGSPATVPDARERLTRRCRYSVDGLDPSEYHRSKRF